VQFQFGLVHWIDPRSIEHNYACLLLRSICGIGNSSQQTSLQCLRRGQDFDKKFVFEGVKRLTDEFPEKSWTKRIVLISCWKVLGHRHSWQAARQRQTAQCPHWRKRYVSSLEVLTVCYWLCSPIVGWSDREHLFVRKEKKVSGILWELLKQKLSALHASSTVRVCQLLCTALLEAFQMQVLTNSPGQRRPMNTRLPWYLTDSPAGLRLVLLT